MNDITPKSFWERPEGKTGTIVLAGLVVGGAILLFKILPFLIVLLQNAIHATILGAVLLAIFYVATDPKFQIMVSTLYKLTMRWLTGIVITLDPIAILKNYVDDLKKNRAKMNEQLNNLKGRIKQLQTLIEQNNRDIQNNISLAEQAKKKGIREVTTVKARKAGRLKDSNITLQALYKKMEILYRVLSKMYDTAGYVIEDLDDQVKVKEQEYKALKAGYSAFKSALSIISGDPDKKAMFDQANDYLVEDYGRKIGEIERFMEISSTFMDSVDIQNGVYEEEGFNLLEQWEKDGASLLLGSDKDYILSQANNSTEVLNVDEPVAMTAKRGSSKYNSAWE